MGKKFIVSGSPNRIVLDFRNHYNKLKPVTIFYEKHPPASSSTYLEKKKNDSNHFFLNESGHKYRIRMTSETHMVVSFTSIKIGLHLINNRVKAVEPMSQAAIAGVTPGWKIISINDKAQSNNAEKIKKEIEQLMTAG